MYNSSKHIVLLTLFYCVVGGGHNGKSIKDDYFTFYRLLQQIKNFNGLVVKTFKNSRRVKFSAIDSETRPWLFCY